MIAGIADSIEHIGIFVLIATAIVGLVVAFLYISNRLDEYRDRAPRRHVRIAEQLPGQPDSDNDFDCGPAKWHERILKLCTGALTAGGFAGWTPLGRYLLYDEIAYRSTCLARTGASGVAGLLLEVEAFDTQRRNELRTTTVRSPDWYRLALIDAVGRCISSTDEFEKFVTQHRLCSNKAVGEESAMLVAISRCASASGGSLLSESLLSAVAEAPSSHDFSLLRAADPRWPLKLSPVAGAKLARWLACRLLSPERSFDREAVLMLRSRPELFDDADLQRFEAELEDDQIVSWVGGEYGHELNEAWERETVVLKEREPIWSGFSEAKRLARAELLRRSTAAEA